MKKFTLIVMCLLMAIGYEAKAQEDYIPFVVEGKVWNFSRSHLNAPAWYGKIYIDGDTIINDIACKKVYEYNFNNDGKTRYRAAFYEKDRKVYCFNSGKESDVLLYNFGMNIGDTAVAHHNTILNDYDVLLKVIGIEKTMSGGRFQRYFVLYNYAEVCQGADESYLQGFWIEGVGTNKYPFDTYPGELPGGNTSLTSCVVDKDTLYSWKENRLFEQALSKKYISGISTVKAGGEARPSGWYDLQGRRLTEPRKGMNIIRYNDGTAKKVLK